MKTAVEWYAIEHKKFREEPWRYVSSGGQEAILQQAKEMEKERIIKAYNQGEFNQGCNADAEQYYNETYINSSEIPTSSKLSCKHFKSHIAEREFYNNQKNILVGTRLICKKCGENVFIKD